MVSNPFARLPKVDQVMAEQVLAREAGGLPRSLVKKAVRGALAELRIRLGAGEEIVAPDISPPAVAAAAAVRAHALAQPSLRPLVNATGVVVHTNLGRSLLPGRALLRIGELNRCYSNLEYDLEAGRRGSRYSHVAGIIRELTGAESALVVNNNAAAVYLCLQTLAAGREVIVSRGQLVEIGGSFRIPDIMARSGAILREVGTTNKTHLKDYEQAINPETALVLKVHTSNFAVVGFHQEVSLDQLAALGGKHSLPVMEDLGSGTLVDFSAHGLPKEPTVQEALAAGADLVTFSGDKLLGGPQAGIILGRADLIEMLRGNPLNRALRIDKLTLAALEATLEIYRSPSAALEEIPTLKLITKPYARLSRQAAALAKRIRAIGDERLEVTTCDGESRVGGGAMPLAAPKTRLMEVSLKGMSATRLEAALRSAPPGHKPIICRMEDGRLLMDVRTLIQGDGAVIAGALAAIVNQY